MKNVEQITEGKGYTAINMGPLNHIGEYSIIHPKLNTEIFGKLFLKDLIGATGTEISFNVLPPHTEVPYFHRHTDNEETYIILKGCVISRLAMIVFRFVRARLFVFGLYRQEI